MRGCGTIQTLTALEVLIDEAARPRCGSTRSSSGGAMRSSPAGRTMTGNPYFVSVRTDEMLDKLEKHPIWQQRASTRQAHATEFLSAPVSPASRRIGAGADCTGGRVEISTDGRISIHCDHVEMGNGIRTALADRVALATWVRLPTKSVARVDTYEELALVTSGDPAMDQATQNAAARRIRRWVPAISSPTSASIGAPCRKSSRRRSGAR